jgi:hypothetical protein
MKKIISTVGTSLFENFLLAENSKHKAFSDYSHLKKSNHAYVQWENQEKRRKVLENIGGDKVDTSAEIASIIAIQAELGEEVEVHLLATDTILSVLAAELIKKWFEDSANKAAYPGVKNVSFTRPETSFENNETENYVVKDLRIDSKDDYEKGAINILEVLNRITDKNTILNITGGYKVIVPLLTVWAQIKKVQLKYLFNESELAKDNLMPLTLGELPLNLDWNVVEALKPVLKKHLLPRLEPLALCINHDDIAFDDKRQVFVSQNEKTEIPDLPRTFHQVLHAITSYKLVRITEEDKIDLTALGKVFVNSQLIQEDMIGYEMELVLHKLFLDGLDEIDLLKGYRVSKRTIDLNRFFKVVDRSKKQIQFCDAGDKDRKEIGDMDIALEKEGALVWAEAKAFQAFCTIKDSIGKGKDYFFQLKARAKAVIDSPNHTGNMEILLLVFKFVFKGLNDDAFTASDHFNVVSNYLNGLNDDDELNGKASIRCIGIKVPITFNSNRIDMTAFYKCKYDNWEFEEIMPNQHQLSESTTKMI